MIYVLSDSNFRFTNGFVNRTRPSEKLRISKPLPAQPVREIGLDVDMVGECLGTSQPPPPSILPSRQDDLILSVEYQDDAAMMTRPRKQVMNPNQMIPAGTIPIEIEQSFGLLHSIAREIFSETSLQRYRGLRGPEGVILQPNSILQQMTHEVSNNPFTNVPRMCTKLLFRKSFRIVPDEARSLQNSKSLFIKRLC